MRKIVFSSHNSSGWLICGKHDVQNVSIRLNSLGLRVQAVQVHHEE